MTGPKWMGTAYPHPDDVREERWRRSMQTREGYEAMVHERADRDRLAPKVGEEAPDFEARRLSGDGLPFRLSRVRGRPVALVFGSYT
ncbi:MAG: hypothetical protein HOI95_10695 [Chromatiales bacterium]|jgi:hypothetical protein|nr:hypothetical protein [Chromatiales bacterium]